ncbi:MAG: hypothetical protein ABFE07_06140 [Armatimonadia bacterium]
MAGFISGLADSWSKQLDDRRGADAYAPLLEAVYGGQPAQQQTGGFLSQLLGFGQPQPVAPGAEAVAAPIAAAPPVSTPGQMPQSGTPAGSLAQPTGALTQPTGMPAIGGGGQLPREAILGLLARPETREQGVALLMNGGRLPKPKSDLTDDQREYLGAVQQGYKGDFLSYQERLKAAGRSSTNVNVNAGGDNKQVFTAVADSYEKANAAANGLNAIREAKAALNAGGIFGAGADFRLGLQKVGAALGVADTAPITNTETFRAAIAPQVSAMLKATVGSTQISNSDREFAEKAAGGSITLDPSSIARLLDIMERAQRGVVEGHNKRLDLVYPKDNPQVQRERALFAVQVPDLPAMTPPPAQSPAAPAAGPVMAPKSKAEYDALPSGTPFVAPDGTTRVKP